MTGSVLVLSSGAWELGNQLDDPDDKRKLEAVSEVVLEIYALAMRGEAPTKSLELGVTRFIFSLPSFCIPIILPVLTAELVSPSRPSS